MIDKIPQISRVSNFLNGETIQIFGENFDNDCKIFMWHIYGEAKDLSECALPNECTAPIIPPSDALEFPIDRAADSQVLFFGENKPFPPSGVSVLWVKNSYGFSMPYVVNKPQIWLTSLKEVYPTGKIAVCGINFFSKHNVKAIIISKETNSVYPLDFLLPDSYAYDIHNYKAEFLIPRNVPNGEYSLYLHCASGNEFGWSNAIDIKVKSTFSVSEHYRLKWNRQANENRQFPKCEIVNVAIPKLGMFTDSYADIQTAIDSLKGKGGIVLLDAGTYALSRTLTLHEGVVLQGSGNCATVLCATPNSHFNFDWSDVAFAERKNGTNRWAKDWQPHFMKYNPAPLVRIYNDAGIDNIAFRLGDGADIGILVASKTQEPCVGAFVNNCVIDGGNQLTYQINNEFGAISTGISCVSNTRELTVYNNRITTFVPISILPAKNYYVKCIKNHFEHYPRQMRETYFCGLYESYVEQNNFVSGRRSMMVQDGFENNFIYQNRSLDVARSENALEVYMAENGGSEWCGKATEIGEDYICVDYDLDILGLGIPLNERLSEYNYYLCIIDGKGLGQYKKVIKTENRKIYLQNDFDVLPDQNTTFALCKATVRNLWIDNNSILSNGHSQFIWICGLENVMAGHVCDLAAGIRLYSHYLPEQDHLTARLSPVAFNRVSLCQLRSSGKGIYLESGYSRRRDASISIPEFEKTVGNFGNVISGNAVDGSAGLMYTKNQWAWLKPISKAAVAITGNYNIICKNTILGCKYAIEIKNENQCNSFANNVFQEDCTKFIGAGKPSGNDI